MSSTWEEELLKYAVEDNSAVEDYDVGSIVISSSGMGDFFELTENSYKEAASIWDVATSRKVASLEDLKGFQRVAGTNTLVRLSEQDLWTLRKDAEGAYYVERLFDEDGNPITSEKEEG